MPLQKFILLGCDDTTTLSTIFNYIKRAAVLPYHIISATRVSDLLDILKSSPPDIIILAFRNNQPVLNGILSFNRKLDIPVLCLSANFEHEKLQWPENNAVFVYPFTKGSPEHNLLKVINSILLLKTGAHSKPQGHTLAEAAMHRGNSDMDGNLSRYVMELEQKTEMLAKIKERIAELYTRVDDPIRVELISIVNGIKLAANNKKLWDDFKLYFEKTDPNFLLILAEKYPGLTPIDLKYCCYLKMNMSNDDIGNLLGINLESVRTHKYRLKKKMSLAKDQDLRNFLKCVDPKRRQLS
jgi:DNA-binding CsgD family transcriptional regulator